MQEKLKHYTKHPYAQQLRDTRVIGLLAFGVIVLLVSWSMVQIIETNYVLQQRIARIEQQNNVYELENVNRKLRNEYFNTDEYIELQARKQFGKAMPGETLILVSKEKALQNTVEIPNSDTENNVKPKKPSYQANFEAWMDFFFRRRTG